MMTKTELSVFAIMGIAAIIAISSVIVLDQTQNQVDVFLKPDEPYPHEIPHWQGVPTLAMNPSPSDRTDYHELKGTEFTWLQRLVKNSEIIVNDREIKEFFDYSEGIYLYKINDKLYTIHYTDNPSLRLDGHYIKAFPSDELSVDLGSVSSKNPPWLQKAISDPFNWIPITESELNDYKSFTNSGKDLINNINGYNLRYIGADLSELEKQEFGDIYNKSIGIFEENTP